MADMDGLIRDDRWKRASLDAYLNTTLKGNEMDNSATINQTKAIINGIFLDEVQQTRYIHIAFGTVSMALSLWIVFRVWYDSWRATKLRIKLRPR